MVRKKLGRRKGRRSKGYFYRAARGWFTKQGGKFVPLTASDGSRLRDEHADDRCLKEALARVLLQPPAPPAPLVPEDDAEVGTVCAKYLEHLKGEAGTKKTGAGKTYIDRGQTLFDFCYGLPGKFFCGGDRAKRAQMGDGEADRIHPGYGAKLCSELTPSDIGDWLNAHQWKPGGRRTRIQAIKRAFNFGVQQKLIARNPIRGYKVPESGSRVTYLTPDQEAALLQVASPAFAMALQVCIRTGARFGCEFAALTPRHVRDHGDKMEWVFKADETKTKKKRIIRITDPAVIQLARQGMGQGGAVFRNQNGQPWTRSILSQNFRRAAAKIKANGMHLDPDACMYSCRHTYAKRALEGFWTGKPTSLNTLARLMGNSVKVCIKHYLEFSEADTAMLWTSA